MPIWLLPAAETLYKGWCYKWKSDRISSVKEAITFKGSQITSSHTPNWKSDSAALLQADRISSVKEAIASYCRQLPILVAMH